MYGPLLPSLSERWGMRDGRAGMLIGAVFLCAVMGALAVTLLLRRYRGWSLMVWGFVMVGLGALGLSSSQWLAGFLGSGMLGFGLGLVNPTANLAAAEMSPGRTGSALTMLNVFFGVGAMTAPPAIGYCIEHGWSDWFPSVFGALTLGGALLASRLQVEKQTEAPRLPAGATHGEAADNSDALTRPSLIRFTMASMLLLFLYVGVEVSLGGWSTTYLLRATDASAMLAASAPSAFWGAILLSRLITIGILPRVGMMAVLLVGSALSLVGSAWLLGPDSPLMVLVAVAVAGIGLGPVFPNGVGYFLEHGGRAATRLTGLVFASGSVGGAVLPMLIGQVSERSGNLSLAMAMIPCGAALMLAAVGLAAWLRPDRQAA
ncbi:MAG: MFS transporter [Bryobacterales bacterium]|nr:MFS transporter [Bryobacterales bacterium]